MEYASLSWIGIAVFGGWELSAGREGLEVSGIEYFTRVLQHISPSMTAYPAVQIGPSGEQVCAAHTCLLFAYCLKIPVFPPFVLAFLHGNFS
jgi:hypothetical protein